MFSAPESGHGGGADRDETCPAQASEVILHAQYAAAGMALALGELCSRPCFSSFSKAVRAASVVASTVQHDLKRAPTLSRTVGGVDRTLVWTVLDLASGSSKDGGGYKCRVREGLGKRVEERADTSAGPQAAVHCRARASATSTRIRGLLLLLAAGCSASAGQQVLAAAAAKDANGLRCQWAPSQASSGCVPALRASGGRLAIGSTA